LRKYLTYIAIPLFLCGLGVVLWRPKHVTAQPVKPDPPARLRLREAYGRLPLSFEPNLGQTDPQVKFLSRGSGYTLFLTDHEAVLALAARDSGLGKERILGPIPNVEHRIPTVLRMNLLGTNPAAEVTGMKELPGKSNYFLGDDYKMWHSGVPNYAAVKYHDVYTGVDLVYYGNQGRLEYDFVVAPGTDLTVVRLSIETGRARFQAREWKLKAGNAKRESLLHIAANGDLLVSTEGGEVRLHKPIVYQLRPAADSRSSTARDKSSRSVDSVLRAADKRFVQAKYVIRNDMQIGFEIGTYDKSKPLVIDPTLTYSTYLGGGGGDAASAIALDSSGNTYITGTTASTNFPTASPEQSTLGGSTDAFVAKLNSSGSKLVYSTYLGGNGSDVGSGIAIDPSGNAYVTGTTYSANFPTTKGTLQTAYGGGGDVFVAKLNPAGSMLVYSSFLGGSGPDFGQAVAVDSSGNAYVTGSTQSTNFPTAKPLQSAGGGGEDAFVAKLNAMGAALTYSTYLGGTAADSGQGIALDSSGDAYVTGFTSSPDFPVTPGAFQPHCGGFSSGSCPAEDAFVTELNSAGSGLIYSTYLGGNGIDRGFGIALDASGNAYITGDTRSNDFPTSGSAFQTVNGGNDDAFVSKLNRSGSALLFSSFLGGSDADEGFGITVDSANFAYVTGFTRSSNFPTKDPVQSGPGSGSCNGGTCPDAFVSKVDTSGGSLAYSTYLGGSGPDSGQAVVVDGSGNAYIAGSTTSANFPVIAGAFQSVLGTPVPPGNAFVTKVGASDVPAVSLSPQTINFGNQGTGVASPAQSVTLTNAGSAPLNVTGVSVSGPFGQTNNCLGTVAPESGTCTIHITFSPISTGNATGSVGITDNAAGSPQQISLSGTGVTPAAAVTFSATSLTFPTLTVGTASPPQVVTLTSSGSATLTISKIAIAGDYTQSNNCGSSLTPGASCTISIIFTPKGSGSGNGTLSVTDNASGSPQTVGLNGSANPSFSLTAAATSAALTIGATSASFSVSAAGSLSGAMSLACAAVSTSVGMPTCTFNPTSINIGQTSQLSVTGLSGTSPNPYNFLVNGQNSDKSQTAQLTLTINFADFSLSALGPDGVHALATVNAGQTAKYTVFVSPINGFNQSVSLSCAYLTSATAPKPPGGSTCSVSPTSATPNGTAYATAVMSVTTTSHSLAGPRGSQRLIRPLDQPRAIPYILAFLFVSMLVTLAASPRRPQPAWVGVGVLVVCLLAWAGCSNYGYFGGFSEFGGIAQKGTPSGNYSLTVTGTLGSGSSAVTRTATVNLSVN